LIATVSAVWLGSAVLFCLFHRLGPRIALEILGGIAVLAIAVRYRILPLGPFEEWYEDFQHNRRMAHMRRLARAEQIEADPVNQEILFIQQFGSPRLMLMLRPEEFFDVAVHHFRLLGYARRHQRISGGGPTDAILRQGEELYMLRCVKLDEGTVDDAEVRALAALLEKNCCAGGVLVTNLAFTDDAEQAAMKLSVTLLDGKTLAGSIMGFQLRDPTAQKSTPRPRRLFPWI
jgi:hypothetical protein